MTKNLFYLVLFCSISFTGCGSDPILDRAEELKKENSIEKSTDDSGKKSNSSLKEPMKPGIPKEPTPVQVKPKPKPKPQKKESAQITIAGNISIMGKGDWKDKPIRIDIFDGDQRALEGPRPKVIST